MYTDYIIIQTPRAQIDNLYRNTIIYNIIHVLKFSFPVATGYEIYTFKEIGRNILSNAN